MRVTARSRSRAQSLPEQYRKKRRSSRDDLRAFPKGVTKRVRGALREAQLGRKAPYAKPLKGFGGAGVLEVVDDYDGNTYRAVYTIRFAQVVDVLHAFQKKAKRGIATPRADLAVIRQRLQQAREDYAQWQSVQRS